MRPIGYDDSKVIYLDDDLYGLEYNRNLYGKFNTSTMISHLTDLQALLNGRYVDYNKILNQAKVEKSVDIQIDNVRFKLGDVYPNLIKAGVLGKFYSDGPFDYFGVKFNESLYIARTTLDSKMSNESMLTISNEDATYQFKCNTLNEALTISEKSIIGHPIKSLILNYYTETSSQVTVNKSLDETEQVMADLGFMKTGLLEATQGIPSAGISSIDLLLTSDQAYDYLLKFYGLSPDVFGFHGKQVK